MAAAKHGFFDEIQGMAEGVCGVGGGRRECDVNDMATTLAQVRERGEIGERGDLDGEREGACCVRSTNLTYLQFSFHT